jgi:predicted RNase H-like nuclease
MDSQTLVQQIRVIGIDCATDDAKVGIAAGFYHTGCLRVTELELCAKERTAASLTAKWLAGADRALIAIDAPLGWPKPLADSLVQHLAGDYIGTAAHELFRRQTDRHVYDTTGKMPLDVGADRIARTAYAALKMLRDIRQQLGKPIPLAWSSTISDVVAIEVYPAATLSTHGFPYKTYKKIEQRAERQVIIDHLRSVMELPADTSRLVESADVLDAVACLLAAKDFIEGIAMEPGDLDRARREGWIWVRKPR